MSYWKLPDTQIAIDPERFGLAHSEFLKLFQCEYNPRPYTFARECWDRYDAQADNVRSPGRLFGEIVRETYDEAVSLGFGGDMDEWGRTIKKAQPHSEEDRRRCLSEEERHRHSRRYTRTRNDDGTYDHIFRF